MSLSWPAKDPDEILDYDVDWTVRLYSEAELASYNAGAVVVPADSIASSTWTIASGTVAKQSDSNTSTATKIWLTGGALGEGCILTNEITTTGGRRMDQSVKLKIKAK
jgi:hypothetical protein